MQKGNALKLIPKEGFLKLTREDVAVPEDRRIALIRKGNELFNKGQIDLAKKIFLTAGYADGLVRLGDRYAGEKKPFEAFRMYWLARHRKKTDAYIERMSGVIRQWLHEER